MAYIHIQQEDKAIKKKFADLIPKSIKKEIKSQEKLDKQYVEFTEPIIQALRDVETNGATPERFDATRPDATLIGSMTGTGPGYSWSNAPGRLATATEQLRIPAITGYKIATSTTPAGMTITLGVGIYRVLRTYA
jgi:hypothetical protein